MALQFITPDPAPPLEPQVRTDRRLYWTADVPPRVVEEGDPAARSLWVGVNGLISLADAQRYGLLDDQATEAQAPASDEGAVAEAEPAPSAPTAVAEEAPPADSPPIDAEAPQEAEGAIVPQPESESESPAS